MLVCEVVVYLYWSLSMPFTKSKTPEINPGNARLRSLRWLTLQSPKYTYMYYLTYCFSIVQHNLIRNFVWSCIQDLICNSSSLTAF